MTTENNGVRHEVIEISGQKLVAEIDVRGELVKTWPAGDRSDVVIAASVNLKDPKLGK